MLVGDTGEVVGVDRAAAAWASRWKGRVPVFAHEFTHCLLMHQQTAAFDEHWRAAVECDERRRREEANRASGALEPSEVLIVGIGCTTAPSGDEEAILGAVRSRIADCEAHRPQAFDLAKQPRMRSGSTSAAGRGMATPRDPCGAALGALRRAANLSPRPFTTLEDELPNCHQRAAVTQYRSATPRFAILARTETADSPAGAFPSSRAPHRPWQDLGRVREVTKSEPRRDDRRARDANPEPSRDPLGQKARPARTST